jgi:hypothetical protein
MYGEHPTCRYLRLVVDGARRQGLPENYIGEIDLEDLRETFRSVMRNGPRYLGEDAIRDLARYLRFARLTDTSGDAIKSAINSAIRHGLRGDEGSMIWRED